MTTISYLHSSLCNEWTDLSVDNALVELGMGAARPPLQLQAFLLADHNLSLVKGLFLSLSSFKIIVKKITEGIHFSKYYTEDSIRMSKRPFPFIELMAGHLWSV